MLKFKLAQAEETSYDSQVKHSSTVTGSFQRTFYNNDVICCVKN